MKQEGRITFDQDYFGSAPVEEEEPNGDEGN